MDLCEVHWLLRLFVSGLEVQVKFEENLDHLCIVEATGPVQSGSINAIRRVDINPLFRQKLDSVQESIDAGVVEGSPAIKTAGIRIELVVWILIVVHFEDVNAALARSYTEWCLV